MSQDKTALAAPAVGPQISISGGSITEGNLARLVYTVTLSAPAVDVVTVNYRLTDSGTVSDSDMNYPLWSDNNRGKLSIAAGQTQGTITLNVAHDALDEVDEFAVLELFNPTGGHFLDGYPTLRTEGVILDNDGAGSNLALFVGDPVIVEGDAGSRDAVFTIRLSRPATQAFTATYETVNGSALAGSDFQAASGTVTFALGQETATVRVPVSGDGAIETGETFHLRVSPPAGLAIDASNALGTATIMDDDAGTGPVLSVAPSQTLESYESRLGFTLTLSEAPIDAVTVQYRLVSATANDTDIQGGFADSDYRGTVTFGPGETSTTLTFWTSGNDATDERDEHLILELFDASGAALAGGGPVLRTMGVIQDNDGTGSNLSLFLGDPVLVEGESGQREALFEVRLSRPATAALTFAYATKDGSAAAGSDYQAVSGNLAFQVGQDVAYVRVPVFGDSVAEATESFFLSLTPPDGLSIGLAGATGEARILADEGGGKPVISIARQTGVEDYNGALRFHVSLSSPATDGVTVAYRVVSKTATDADMSGSFASKTGTITFAPGATSTELSLPSIGLGGDGVDEVDEAFTIELYNPVGGVLSGGEPVLRATGIILDDYPSANSNLAIIVGDPVIVEGNAGVSEALFEVRLSRPQEQAVSVTYTTIDGNAVAGEDYQAMTGSLTFAPGQDVAFVRVPIVADRMVEASEYFSLVVTPPADLAIAKAAAGGRALIMDDDASVDVPVISISPAVGGEDYSGAMRFVVTLSRPATDAVTVQVRTSLGTAVDSDLWRPASASQNNGTLTIPAGATSASFTIDLSGDNLDERDETILVTLSDPVGAVLAGGGERISAFGTILDDDGVGLNIALIAHDQQVQEKGAGEQPVEVLLSLTRPSETALTFDVGIAPGSTVGPLDYVLHDQQVTFAPGQTVAGVSLSVRGDVVLEGSETLVLTYTPVAGAAIAGAMPTSTITILDFVPPVLSVAAVNPIQTEGQAGTISTYSFTVTRDGNLVEESSVQWAVTGLGERGANAADFAGGVLPSGSVSFAAGERTATITVQVAGDRLAEGDEGFRLTLSNASAAIISQATADAVIRNDDWTQPIFATDAYQALNPDLRAVFGTDDSAYVRHYINYGRAEGRLAAGFDAEAYAALNPDLFVAFGLNADALADHYRKFGIAEGRLAVGFEADAYAALNPDLYAAFGTNHAALVNHYIYAGRAEGRVTGGFDAEAYAALNPDLFNAFGLNTEALISHYINYGRGEGRSATGFDAETYAALNPDLFNIFGLNHATLINHYIYAGKAEGRPAYQLPTTTLGMVGMIEDVAGSSYDFAA